MDFYTLTYYLSSSTNSFCPFSSIIIFIESPSSKFQMSLCQILLHCYGGGADPKKVHPHPRPPSLWAILFVKRWNLTLCEEKLSTCIISLRILRCRDHHELSFWAQHPMASVLTWERQIKVQHPWKRRIQCEDGVHRRELSAISQELCGDSRSWTKQACSFLQRHREERLSTPW